MEYRDFITHSWSMQARVQTLDILILSIYFKVLDMKCLFTALNQLIAWQQGSLCCQSMKVFVEKHPYSPNIVINIHVSCMFHVNNIEEI